MAKKYPRVIVIAGKSGSGKSTLMENLANALSYEKADGGDMARRVAKEKEMTIEAFRLYRIDNPTVDFEIDDKLLALIKNTDGAVVQSRLMAYFDEVKASDAVTVLLIADEAERARRVAARDGLSEAEAAKRVHRADERDIAHFKKIYGIDITDQSVYDLVIDSTRRDATELAAFVLEQLAETAA